MNCHDARLELEALLPRESRSAPLIAHLAHCAACRTHAERLAVVDARLGAHFGAFAPRPEFDARLRAALARAQRERSDEREPAALRDPEPLRRLLRVGSILDGCAAVGVGATVLALAVHEHTTLERWLVGAAGSAEVAGITTPAGVVLVAVTLAGVAAVAAATWRSVRRL